MAVESTCLLLSLSSLSPSLSFPLSARAEHAPLHAVLAAPAAAALLPRCTAPSRHHSSTRRALPSLTLRSARARRVPTAARRQPRPAEHCGRDAPAPALSNPSSLALPPIRADPGPLLARHARREPWPPPPTATAAPRAITLSFPKPSTPARPPRPSDPPKPVRPSQSPPASRRRGTEPRRPPASRGAPTSGLLLPQRSPGTGSSNQPVTPCPPERRCR